MRLGLGVLRLSPAHFWSMTPAELVAAVGAVGGQSAASNFARGDLDRLMAAHPDTRTQQNRASGGASHGNL